MAKSKVAQLVEDEDFAAVERLRSMYGPGFSLRISRTDLGRRDFAFLDDWAGAEFPSEVLLRDTYGGGRYQLEVRDGEHQYVKGGRAYITIAGPAKSGTAAQPQGGLVDPTVRFALDTMQKIVTDGREQKASKPQDLPALITAVSGAIVALATLLRQPDSGSKLKELRELLAVVKDLTPEPSGRNDGGGGEGMAGAIIEGVRTLADLVKREGRGQLPEPAAGPGAGEPPAPDAAAGGKPEAGAEAPPPEQAGQEWLAALRPFLQELLELAADNADPALYADVYVDQLERKQPLVLEFLDAKLAGDPGAAALFQTEFFRAVPEAAQLQPWFVELFTELRRALLERRADLAAAPDEPGADAGAGGEPDTP